MQVVNPFTKYPFLNIWHSHWLIVLSYHYSFIPSLRINHRKYKFRLSLIRFTYALTMSPVALSLEELIPSNHLKSHVYALCIRTALVLSTLLVALIVPFFGNPLFPSIAEKHLNNSTSLFFISFQVWSCPWSDPHSQCLWWVSAATSFWWRFMLGFTLYTNKLFLYRR